MTIWPKRRNNQAKLKEGWGANNNVLIGNGGTIKDLGSDNQITGLKPLTK